MCLTVYIKANHMSTKLYEVTLTGHLFQQEIVNRWNYRSDGDDVPSGNSFALASAMGLIPVAGAFPADTLAHAIANVIAADMHWEQVIVRAVYDPLDFVDIPFSPVAPGLIGSGDTESPFLAFGFKTNRVRTDIGRGYKRISGLVEGAIADGGVIESGSVSALTDIADLMSDILPFTESALTINFTPCVVKKQRYTAPSGKPAYRYIPVADGGEAAQLELIATGITWAPYDTVRSQVSRQYGRGR